MASLRDRFERLFRGNEDWYGQYEADPVTGEKRNAYTKADLVSYIEAGGVEARMAWSKARLIVVAQAV